MFYDFDLYVVGNGQSVLSMDFIVDFHMDLNDYSDLI